MSKQRGLKAAPPAGTKVRLTGYFLRSTGQVKGGEGSKRWTVLAGGDCGFAPCLCGSRDGNIRTHVAVDEPLDDETVRAGYYDIKSTRTDGRLMRHIAIGNLEIVGAPPKAADQADDVGPFKVL
jgi:hypothetical protein